MTHYGMTGGNSVPPLWFVQNAPSNPYRDAADALARAHDRAVEQRRPYAERRHLEHARDLCRRLADQTREDEQ